MHTHDGAPHLTACLRGRLHKRIGQCAAEIEPSSSPLLAGSGQVHAVFMSRATGRWPLASAPLRCRTASAAARLAYGG
jgi:hypothetical protein